MIVRFVGSSGRHIYLKHMPTILSVDGFRFYIDKDAATAKVWLHDVTVARSIGFSAQDLGKIQPVHPPHAPASAGVFVRVGS